MLKLYYVPGTCALCPHIVLHETGVSFATEKVDPKNKNTESGQDYNAINPKSYVPALVMNNGQLLTEVAVIVQYIADLAPGKNLAAPAGTLERYRLQEWLNFVSSEIHKGFSPLFNPGVPEETKTLFKERLAARLNVLAKTLGGNDYLMGQSFTVADAYLYTVLRWSPRVNMDLSPWPVLKDYMARIAARPAVKAALSDQGLQA